LDPAPFKYLHLIDIPAVSTAAVLHVIEKPYDPMKEILEPEKQFKGLSSAEAGERLKADGYNELAHEKNTCFWT